MDTIPMSTRGQKRQSLVAALDAAAADHRDLKSIAQEAAVPYGALLNLRSHGYIGSERAAALSAWLADHGYLPGKNPPPGMVTITTEDPLLQATSLLQHTAAMLANQTLPRAQRIALLETQLRALQILSALLTSEQKPTP